MSELAEAAWSMTTAVGGRLADVSPALLAAGLALHALKLGARARAWQNVLRASLPGPVRFRDAAAPYLAGTGAGCVVPFGGGELVRVALARTQLRCGEDMGGETTATFVGSLAVERTLDLAVSSVVVVLALTAGRLPNGVLHGKVAAVADLLAHPLVAGLFVAAVALAAAAAWRLRRRLAPTRTGILRGLLVLRRPTRYLRSVASWQLVAWALRFGALVLLLEAFHVRGALAVAPVILALQLLAASVPLTPAGAGTQQALVAAALGGDAFAAFSAGAQLATMLVDVALGLIALACCGGRLRLRAWRPAPTSA
jgi:uncharacterized membrane protein YbhN (UPF0104 family)